MTRIIEYYNTTRRVVDRRCSEDQLIPKYGNMDLEHFIGFDVRQYTTDTLLSRRKQDSTIYEPNIGPPGSAPITCYFINAPERNTNLGRPKRRRTSVYPLKPATTPRRQRTLSDFNQTRPHTDQLFPTVFKAAGFNLHDQWELSVRNPTKTDGITPEEQDPQLIDPSDPVEDVPLPPEAHRDAYTAQEGQCGHCGSYHLGPQAWEPETPTQAEPCTGDEVKTCMCCVCPECSVKSIYHRKSKVPHYRCINCEHEFDAPHDPSHDPEGRDANPPPKCLSCERTAW